MTLKDQMLASAQAWAEHAYLRSARTCDDRTCAAYTVEDALSMCILMIAMAEECEC